MDINQYPKVKELLRKQVEWMVKDMFGKVDIPMPEVIDESATDSIIDAIVAQNPRPIYRLLDDNKLIISVNFYGTFSTSINGVEYAQEFDDRVKAEEFVIEEAFKMLEK